MANAKCPKCGKAVASFVLESLPASPAGDDKKKFPTVALTCPSCRAVLGAQIDPIMVTTDTVQRLMKTLQAANAKKT